MTDSISSKASTASTSEAQQREIYSFFDRSPLRSPCCSVRMSEFKHPLELGDFPTGYIRLVNEENRLNELFYVDKKSHVLKRLNLTEDQLAAYDAEIDSTITPAALSTTALTVIAAITDFIPKKATSLHQHAKSMGLIGAPPTHVIAFKIKPLLKTNPALFKYLEPEQRKALELDLHLAFYQLCAQYQAEDILHQRQNLKTYVADIERCASLLRNLELVSKGEKLEAHKQQAENTTGGLNQWYRDKIKLMEQFFLDFSAGKTVYFTRWMSELNVWRAYWGWAGLTMRTALSMMPKNFYNVQQTIDATTDPQESLRLLGSILYCVRFLIHFTLLLKHTIKGPWMSDEEKQLIDDKGGSWNQFTERFAAEKFALINDLVWATNNLVNILWLAKPGLGPFGDMLAMILMVGDVYLSDWAEAEAEKKHQQEIQFYNDEIVILRKKLKGDNSSDTRDKNDEQLLIAQEQLARLEEARDKCEDHWRRQLKRHAAEIYYTAGIAVGFIFMVFPWAEIGAKASAEALIMGSTAFCFALALFYSGYKAYMEVTKAQDSRMSALEECYAILSVNRELREDDSIRYQDLLAQAKYQEEMEKYQYYVFIRSVIIQSIIPIAIFAGFTFATFGIGVAAFAVVVAVSILTHYALEYFKPEEAALAEFEEGQGQEHAHTFSKEGAKNSIETEIEMMKSKGIAGLFSSHKKKKNDFTPDIGDPNLNISN